MAGPLRPSVPFVVNAVPPLRPVPSGESAHISQRQDEPEHLRRLLAYSHLYKNAQWWRRIRTTGTFTLAIAAPIFAFAIPATTDILAAISAGWLVLGRTVLSGLERRGVGKAVRAHELYDTKLFHLPWNTALAGRPPVPDDIAAAASHISDDTFYRGWFSVNLGNTPWPADVLLCQRQSAVWSRRDHQAYGTTILLVGLGWFLVGATIAIVGELTLADYLIKIFLPSSPAFLDSVELAREHWRHAVAREQVENDIHDLWDHYRSTPASLPAGECRQIQDAAFLLRRDGPRVPNFFYRIRRKRSSASTAAGTQAILNDSADAH
ncbi:S-4TM family putative pore-forming effector [Actinomadura sp. NPDC048394]|uniref:S-4TM family putative pore-forming effector n=1 Tax=Actinomadura sp. NPDC048394 TaxID=3158223 RepID=UPI0033E80942